MKKLTGLCMVILLCLGLLSGCGQSYDAQTSTVFVLKDGKVVSTDVENFDENTYDKAGLEAYIKEAVDAYTDSNGADSVKFEELKVEDGSAVLRIAYASAADYAKFNEIELYSGSIAEALAAGYSFDVDFASVKDGNASACSVDDFLGSDYKVVIIRGNVNVNVAGTVAYVSVANTSYVDKSTIAIREGTSIFGSAMQEGTDTEQGQETVTDTQAGETEGTEILDEMVDDDEDLLAASQEDTEMVFEFEEEPESESENTSEFSEVYTYIIYK